MDEQTWTGKLIQFGWLLTRALNRRK